MMKPRLNALSHVCRSHPNAGKAVLAMLAAGGLLAGGAPGLAQSTIGGSMGSPAQPITGTPAPMASLPGNGAAADYQIGAGDLLSIAVYRSPDIGGVVRTGQDGSVVVPGVGPVALDGLTASEASVKIAAEIKRRGILIDPSVVVLVTEVRGHVVQVMGEVGRPGSIPIDQHDMRLSTVLARAGAPFGTGAGIVVVIHPDGTRERFLMADLVSGSNDRPVRSGEVLVVQAAALVYVSGEVGRPGAYPIEKDMTVGQALALAGGYTPSAARGSVRITHKAPGAAPAEGGDAATEGAHTQIAKADLSAPVRPGDLIMVGRRLF
jgi:polysaccharide biosynthesis/export protein